MALKPKKFRVAVSGVTLSGREITPEMLHDAVETFSTEGWSPRVNVEHIRGMSGDKPFGAVGDVIALSVQEDTINIAGNTEKVTALYATIQPNERAIELNKADQKVFTSIELWPNIRGTGKWGFVGLALTDTPDSPATERLEFSRHLGSLLINGQDIVAFDLIAPTETQNAFTQAMGILGDAITALTGGNKPEPAPQPKDPPQALPDQFSTVVKAQSDVIEALAKSTSEQIASLTTLVETQARDFTALKTKLETTEAPSTFNRPPATGGDGATLRAEC